MVQLRQEGRVRAVGLSNHSVPLLEKAEKVGHVDSLQPPLSMINRTQADAIAWCARNGTGVIVYSPMHSGLLTGTFSRERVESLPQDDWRRRSPDFTTNLDRNLALADALRPIASRHGVTQAAVAVAWTLAWPGVTGAIVGARNPGQVDGWLPAASLRLTQDDLDDIAAAIERTGAGEARYAPERVTCDAFFDRGSTPMRTVTWFSPAGQPRRTTSRTAGPGEVAGPRRIAHQGRNKWFLPGGSGMRQCLAKGDGYA